ncbi:ribonuclease J [Paremcibacter congregatus]|uniref:MBL fold hydrolase n=1 Tax=Paremcibacter congregatus TaxID=2043170 RepID=A0A2G4YSS5_9PROT|nr:ribonuclease J [Paremcibacter congregatus]PHZ85327.1 MBL fold hydrolase [Paremcibacter congregatus]QDE27741.1 ribonuclease J [Paremcibacter congregatus]
MAKSNSKDALYFLPLGGSGEIGMNLNLYQTEGKWLMVDCGISFADTYLPGIDLIMPNTSFIEERRDKLAGLIITHAHEDHVGALAHLWERFRCPVYATPFTMILIRLKLTEAGLLDQVPLIEVPLEGSVEVGPFTVDFLSLTHSIPEPNAVVIKTKLGSVFHTGDWKLDPNPLLGNKTNEAKIRKAGDNGVLALVCDSTNVFNVEPSGSEKKVRQTITELLATKKGKVFCATFSSNVARVDTLAQAARDNGRDVCLVGRSLKRNVAAAREAGYLKDFPNIVDESDAGYLPNDRVLYICTGCQGEARAALMRITQGNNRDVTISGGDTVIFSSKIIPGNETLIGRLHNALIGMGAEVITEKDAFVHVSGHPGQKELAQMYEWTRPEILVPVHGELRHMQRQAEFGRAQGIGKTIVPSNGTLIRLAPGPVEIVERFHVGRLALDGHFLIPDEDDAIVTRRRILYNGALVVSLVVDDAGDVLSPPQVSNLGNPAAGQEPFDEVIRDAALAAIGGLTRKQRMNDTKISEAVRVAARKAAKYYTNKETGPVTSVNVTRI